jgi:hypothetical protein
MGWLKLAIVPIAIIIVVVAAVPLSFVENFVNVLLSGIEFLVNILLLVITFVLNLVSGLLVGMLNWICTIVEASFQRIFGPTFVLARLQPIFYDLRLRLARVSFALMGYDTRFSPLVLFSVWLVNQPWMQQGLGWLAVGGIAILVVALVIWIVKFRKAGRKFQRWARFKRRYRGWRDRRKSKSRSRYVAAKLAQGV